MEEIWNQITRLIGAYIPKLLGALAILIVGWLGPSAVAAIVRGGLRRTGLANRLARSVAGEEGVTGVDVERWVGRGVLSLLMLVVLAGAMALRQMGLANEIINLTFGLLLGAIAVAVAIAFGLGGRDIAARELVPLHLTPAK
jgi:hypothetical protein